MSWPKRICATLFLAVAFFAVGALSPMASSQAAITTSEAANAVQAATVWDAVADFDAVFAVPVCGSSYPCWSMANWTYSDPHDTGAAVWISINHFANRYNPPNPYAQYRVIWRGAARRAANGSIYVTDKYRVQGVVRMF